MSNEAMCISYHSIDRREEYFFVLPPGPSAKLIELIMVINILCKQLLNNKKGEKTKETSI